MEMNSKIVIGIDQSYKNTGISVCIDGNVAKAYNLDYKGCKTNSEKRNFLNVKIDSLLFDLTGKYGPENILVIIERIRTQQQKFLNMNYLKSMGALNAVIVDTAWMYDVKVYSVDTRSWKSNVVGTSKPKSNSHKIDPKKFPTILYIKKLGLLNFIVRKLRKNEKTYNLIHNGIKYKVDDDIADAICISLYGFLPESKKKLVLEKY